MKNEKKGKKIEGTRAKMVKNIISALLVIYTFLSIYLIGMTILNSFKTKAELINNTMGWPTSYTLDNFREVILKIHSCAIC